MKIRPLSRGTLITLVTSPGRHPVSPSRLKCNHGVEDNTPGKKCHPGRNLPSLEVAKVRRREKRTMIASRFQSWHVLLHQQKGVFHRPGLPLAGVKCELVTEVRPSPQNPYEERTFATCGNPRISLRLQAGQVSRSARRRPPPPHLLPRANPLRLRVRLRPPRRTRPQSANRW